MVTEGCISTEKEKLGTRVGIPSRDENLDVYPGFKNPPKGYGEVAFYWWLGDKLEKERIKWQIDKLKDHGVMGLQVNYAHSDIGGQAYGLTYESEPSLFTDEWWELFNWFLKEAKENGMSVSLSDYTLGIPGQGWYSDEIINNNPEICGSILNYKEQYVEGNQVVVIEVPENIISIVAYKVLDEKLDIDSKVNLIDLVNNNDAIWDVPQGQWKVISIFYNTNKLSIDPMNPKSGKEVIEKFFQRFENHNLDEGGEGLNFFFSDELTFGVSGELWNDNFLEEFKKRKGYDLLPYIEGLFENIGDITPKIRLDYNDVLVNLEEENYFEPVYNWHEDRGMIYGCDHGGRGKDLVEFGDYFRTQKWNQAPGNDQSHLQSEIIKNKVSSSITHLYERPRTWLEGYHSSGWGTSTADITEATFKNFIMGHNLLTLHGLYYSTHGGWWEWAPPCNHFRMPYWEHMREFMKCSERLSYLLSQGVHCCDIAIMYPVAAVESGVDSDESVSTSFKIGENLFRNGIDFDFMDFESLERATIEDSQISIVGERFKVLIIPAMKVVRHSTLIKAYEFYRAGGTVIFCKSVPEASEKSGYGNKEINKIIEEMFGEYSSQLNLENKTIINRNDNNGLVALLQNEEKIKEFITDNFARDFECLEVDSDKSPWVMHRKIGQRDVYAIYGCEKDSKCFFRTKGKVEIWSPWTGKVIKVTKLYENEKGTIITMPLDKKEVQIIVFNNEYTDVESAWQDMSLVNLQEEILDDKWEFELKPTLDNCWGDYRLPATNDLIGAEVRKLSHKHGNVFEAFNSLDKDYSKWDEVTYSYGTYFWKLGPLPSNTNVDELDKRLAELKCIDYLKHVEIDGQIYNWTPYDFSMRFGLEGNPGHQGYHGLKGLVTNDFISLGKEQDNFTSVDFVEETKGGIYYLWTSVVAEKNGVANIKTGEIYPKSVIINGISVDGRDTVNLFKGNNSLLLRYNEAGRTHFILEKNSNENWTQEYPLSMEWYNKPSVLKFDVLPQEEIKIDWFKFTSAPALKSMEINTYGNIEVWINEELITSCINKGSTNGINKYEVKVDKEILSAVDVVIKISHKEGYYGGAVITEPIKCECGKGIIQIGDWSKIQGLNSYSGGARYSKTIEILKEDIVNKTILDLGNVVSTAEVFVNGNSVGVRVAPPWKFDITNEVKVGLNSLEIEVYNTLANHYTTIPTRYRGEITSGILGPVTISKFKN